MDALTKKRQKVQRVDVRFNPLSNELDAVILAKIECLPVAASHLVKMLLVDYFTGQSGGLGLSPDEMEIFAEMSPRFANKKRRGISPDPAKPHRTESKKHKDADGPNTVAKVVEAKPEAATTAGVTDNKDSNVVVPGSGRPPWGPGNLPPGFDTSDFEDFAG